MNVLSGKIQSSLKSLAIFSVISVLVSGCYFNRDLSAFNTSSPIEAPFSEKPLALDFVGGSTQLQPTLPRNYKTSASVGSTSSVLVLTSSRGYVMHSSVQGILLQ
ncbi:MAG TPA: hypothetical protein VN132_08790 [Bdellovibrio sp.]|nr:hypothetical protein [Bdellovibrio sp.]